MSAKAAKTRGSSATRQRLLVLARFVGVDGLRLGNHKSHSNECGRARARSGFHPARPRSGCHPGPGLSRAKLTEPSPLFGSTFQPMCRRPSSKQAGSLSRWMLHRDSPLEKAKLAKTELSRTRVEPVKAREPARPRGPRGSLKKPSKHFLNLPVIIRRSFFCSAASQSRRSRSLI